MSMRNVALIDVYYIYIIFSVDVYFISNNETLKKKNILKLSKIKNYFQFFINYFST